MNLKPLNDKVVLKFEKKEKKAQTQSGIFLPENNDKEKSKFATVVAVADNVTSVKVNDKVVITSYSGTDIKLDDEKFKIVAEKDILAILE